MAMGIRLPAVVREAFAADDDRPLVSRYAESRDESAFAAVIERHWRMVYGICRRMVGDEHLAEDPCQAVFLVLANNPRRAVGSRAVFDHPYFAVTDGDGNFQIQNAPVGKFRIVYWHENGLRGGRRGRFGILLL